MNNPQLNASTANPLNCSQVYKTFSEGSLKVEVLKGVDLAVKPGEQLAIMGSSGSGKSTLLHLLGGLDKCSSGTVQINGQTIDSMDESTRGQLRNHFLGFIYQFHHLLPEFTALENVAMPLLVRGESIDSIKENAADMLEKVGLGDRLHHKPAELSGGERQRTAIARALVTKPVCVLADEPTGNLDNKTAHAVYDLMLSLNKEMDTSIIMVTHDADLAGRMERIMVLEDGILHRK